MLIEVEIKQFNKHGTTVATQVMSRTVDRAHPKSDVIMPPEIVRKRPKNRTTKRAGRHANTACNFCKARRSKCDRGGEDTCSQCRKAGLECVLDQKSDLRRREHRASLNNDQQLLNDVLESIRACPRLESIALFEIIRDSSSKSEIEQHIAHIKSQSGFSPNHSSSLVEQNDLSFTDSSQGTTMRGRGSYSSDSQSMYSIFSKESSSLNLPELARATKTELSTKSSEDLSTASATPMENGQEEDQNPFQRDKQDDMKMARRKSGLKHDAVTAFGNFPMSSAVRANGYPVDIQLHQLRFLADPLFTCATLNHVDGDYGETKLNYLRQAMTSFRNSARSMIAEGQSVESVLSMRGIELDLLFRNRRHDDPHTVSTWACEFSKAWTFSLPHIKLASVYFSGTFMRWLIMPCQETFDMMSKMMRPLPCQTADIDICNIPYVRKVQTFDGGGYVDRLTYDSLRCNWPYGEEACIVQDIVEGENGPEIRRQLSPEFMEFIDDEKNWTVSKDTLEDYLKLTSNERFQNVRTH